MRKSVLIIFLSFFCLLCDAQTCQQRLDKARDFYNEKKYFDAQKELVGMLRYTCDNPDGWELLKKCNTKLEEIRVQQFNDNTNLTNANGKLVRDTARLQSKIRELRNNTTSLATATGQLQSLQDEIAIRNKTIQSQNDTIAARDQEIAQLRQRIAEMEKAPSTPTDPNASDNQEQLAQGVAALNNLMGDIQSGINQIQNAVSQLNQNTHDDSESLRKSEIAQLQDSFDDLAKVLEGMNKTLADLSKSVKANQKKPCKLKLWFQKKKEERERKKAEKQDNATHLQ